MCAKTYDKLTAAFAGFVIQQLPANLTAEDMQWLMDNPTAAKKFFAGLTNRQALAALAPMFSVSAKTVLAGIAEMETQNCFAGSCYADMRRLLPAKQPATDACTITTLVPSRYWTLAQGVAAILGVTIGGMVAPDKALLERGHTMTLAQVEEMAKKAKAGENVGMRANYSEQIFPHFFFFETGDPNKPVSVGWLSSTGTGWNIFSEDLGCRSGRSAESRLLVRNFDN